MEKTHLDVLYSHCELMHKVITEELLSSSGTSWVNPNGDRLFFTTEHLLIIYVIFLQ